MSSEQILSLISPLSSPKNNNQEIEVVDQDVELVAQENPAEDQNKQLFADSLSNTDYFNIQFLPFMEKNKSYNDLVS